MPHIKLGKVGKDLINMIRRTPSSSDPSPPEQPRRKSTLTKRPLSENHMVKSEELRPPRKSGHLTDPTEYKATKQPVINHTARRPGTIPKMWTPAEDAALRNAVQMFGERNWREIASHVPGRNQLQCNQRWKKAIMPGLVKGKWVPDEDKLLLSLVKAGEDNDWTKISEYIPGRNAKQCKERWFLNLDPSIKRTPWTEEEDQNLLSLHAIYGGRWCVLAKMIPGRTENNVKTRYHSLMRQKAKSRGWTKDEDQALVDALLVYGKKFEEISKRLPDRTQGMVKKRFAALLEADPTLGARVEAVDAANKQRDAQTKLETGSMMQVEQSSQMKQQHSQPQKRMPKKKPISWLESQPLQPPGPGSMLRTTSQQILLGILDPEVAENPPPPPQSQYDFFTPQAMDFDQQQPVRAKKMPQKSESLSMLEQLLSGNGDVWEEAEKVQMGTTNSSNVAPFTRSSSIGSFGEIKQKQLAPKGTYGSSGGASLLDLFEFSRISQDPRVSTGSSRSLLGDLDLSMGGSNRSLGSAGRGMADMRPLAEVLNM